MIFNHYREVVTPEEASRECQAPILRKNEAEVSLEINATSNTNRRPRTMKSFWLNGYSGRQERWALDGHRWVAAEPRRNGFDLWGYQDDAPEIVYLGSGANEEQLEKLADEFLLGDPERINPAFILKDAYQ
jgi:hypothetical protein